MKRNLNTNFRHCNSCPAGGSRGTIQVAKLLIALLLLTCAPTRAADAVVELEKGSNDTDAKFVVRDLPEQLLENATQWNVERWQHLFSIYTVIEQKIAPTAILGEYSLAKNKLTFTPRYPLRRGVTYRAVLRLTASTSGKGQVVTRDFPVADGEKRPSTTLTAIYPTRDVVPENLLKFYFHFSAPVSRGEVYARVRLRDGKGQQVEAPFLELSEELWSPDGMRLTLYFDPGRIKRGLQPRELFGPALIEGGHYTLEIDPQWPDAQGNALASPEKIIKKSFRVTAPDDQQPNAKRWKMFSPTAGTRIPLTMEFDEPLDSAMLVRVLNVRDAAGKLVAGEVTLGKHERSWSFRPDADWKSGKYALTVATALEDLAGNSLGRPFEVDVFRPLKTQAEAETATLPFEIKPAGQ